MHQIKLIKPNVYLLLSKIASMCKPAANTDENLESELKRYENHFESSIDKDDVEIIDTIKLCFLELKNLQCIQSNLRLLKRFLSEIP